MFACGELATHLPSNPADDERDLAPRRFGYGQHGGVDLGIAHTI
jgi:hypothetical protein